MNQFRAGAKSQSGFTLIELLVVISIVAILISILLPALAAARASGQMAKCASTLRQMGLTLEVYAQDYPRYGYPPSKFDTAAGDTYNQWWYARLFPYFHSGRTPDLGNFEARRDPFYRCPAAYPEEGWWGGPAGGASNYGVGTYAYNGRLGGAYYGTPLLPVKPSGVYKPSRTFAFVDVDNRVDIRYIASPGSQKVYDSVSGAGDVIWRHQSSANFVFIDGHVEALRTDYWVFQRPLAVTYFMGEETDPYFLLPSGEK